MFGTPGSYIDLSVVCTLNEPSKVFCNRWLLLWMVRTHERLCLVRTRTFTKGSPIWTRTCTRSSDVTRSHNYNFNITYTWWYNSVHTFIHAYIHCTILRDKINSFLKRNISKLPLYPSKISNQDSHAWARQLILPTFTYIHCQNVWTQQCLYLLGLMDS